MFFFVCGCLVVCFTPLLYETLFIVLNETFNLAHAAFVFLQWADLQIAICS